MTNFEKYRDEIVELCEKGENIAIVNGKLRTCKSVENCEECDYCWLKSEVIKWLYQENIEVLEKPKLTQKQRKFCELVESGYIATDEDGTQYFYKSSHKPHKEFDTWESVGFSYLDGLDIHFDFITWFDCEPWSIEDLLKLEVEGE